MTWKREEFHESRTAASVSRDARAVRTPRQIAGPDASIQRLACYAGSMVGRIERNRERGVTVGRVNDGLYRVRRVLEGRVWWTS